MAAADIDARPKKSFILFIDKPKGEAVMDRDAVIESAKDLVTKIQSVTDDYSDQLKIFNLASAILSVSHPNNVTIYSAASSKQVARLFSD